MSARTISQLPRQVFRSPLFWIILAGLAAHVACLWSDFYLDDYLFVLQGDGKSRVPWTLEFLGMEFGNGVEGVQPLTIAITQLLSILAFDGIHWLFGPSAAAFHAANLLVHLVAACLAYRVGRLLLQEFPLFASVEKNERTAVFGALLFAVHPLGTEPVNYAKCLMLQMVVAFGLWTLERFLIQLRRPSPKNALWLAAALAGTLFSYFPGVIVAFGGMGLILAARWRDFASRLTRRQKLFTLLAPALLALAVTPFFAGYIVRLWTYTTLDHRISHMLTQGRVFWLYLEKLILPVNLCSDHFIAWTISVSDTAAVAATVGVAALALGILTTLFFSKRERVRSWALVAALAVVPLLYRFLYVNHEAMVEYRTYPALPWLCLLLGAGAATLAARRRRAVDLALGGGLAILALLSCARSQVWHDHFMHCENVVAQYPLNNRARAELVTQSFGIMDWEPIPALVQDAYAAKSEIDAFNRSQTKRAYSTYLSTLPMIYLEHYYARYLSVTEGADAGIRRIDQAIAALQGTPTFAAFRGASNQVIGIRPLKFAREDISAHKGEIDRFAKAWKEIQAQQRTN